MKLKCLEGESLFTTVGKTYKTVRPDGGALFIEDDFGTYSSVNPDTLRLVINSDVRFEVVEQQEVPEEPPVTLEQIMDWCAEVDVDITITSNGTFSVFDGATERQCEISCKENLVQLLQIMVSYKESLDSFGRWV